MDTVPLITTLVLAGVSLVASLSKLANRPGSRQALMALVMDLGVPAPLATPLKILLPLAELARTATSMPSGRSATVPA